MKNVNTRVIAFINSSNFSIVRDSIKASNPQLITMMLKRLHTISNAVISVINLNPSKFSFSTTDNIILYHDIIHGVYKLGKWSDSTLVCSEDYENKDCRDITEFNNKFTNYLKVYSNENRLQEEETPNGERNEQQGVAIEVKGSSVTVETRPLSNGTIISC